MRDPLPAAEPGPLIIGIGSPFGDDRVGWAVADALRRQVPPGRARILTLASPAGLLDALSGQHLAILLDGAVTGDPPGRIHRLGIGDLPSWPGTASSHGVGLGEMLTLGRALGLLPQRLYLYLISLAPEPARGPDCPLSPPVARAAAELAVELAGDLVHAENRLGIGCERRARVPDRPAPMRTDR